MKHIKVFHSPFAGFFYEYASIQDLRRQTTGRNLIRHDMAQKQFSFNQLIKIDRPLQATFYICAFSLCDYGKLRQVIEPVVTLSFQEPRLSDSTIIQAQEPGLPY